MRKHVNARKPLSNPFFILLAMLLFLVTSCTKNDDTECPECDPVESIVIDDTLIFQESAPDPDTTNIVIDDTLIF